MRILYVEDNPVNLSLIQRIAQMNKHELTSFDEAEIALVELEKGLEVDLILLDIQLAGEMDGIGLAKAIRQRGWKQPIIAITAYAMMGDRERILEAGCNEYLPKPLPIAEFLTLLAKYDPSNMAATAASTPVTTTEAATPAPATPAASASVEAPVPVTPAKAESTAMDTKPIETKTETKPETEPPKPEVKEASSAEAQVTVDAPKPVTETVPTSTDQPTEPITGVGKSNGQSSITT